VGFVSAKIQIVFLITKNKTFVLANYLPGAIG
jgi:hypothetical protein